MKPKPPNPEKHLAEDLKTFGNLPEKTKEMQLLTDQAEKTSGSKRASLDRLIQKKSK